MPLLQGSNSYASSRNNVAAMTLRRDQKPVIRLHRLVMHTIAKSSATALSKEECSSDT
jgi:hypothetical protein